MPKPLISAAQAAALIGVSDRRLRMLCDAGRVIGAMRIAGRWVMPSPPVVMAAGRVRPGKVYLTRRGLTPPPVRKS